MWTVHLGIDAGPDDLVVRRGKTIKAPPGRKDIDWKSAPGELRVRIPSDLRAALEVVRYDTERAMNLLEAVRSELESLPYTEGPLYQCAMLIYRETQDAMTAILGGKAASAERCIRRALNRLGRGQAKGQR